VHILSSQSDTFHFWEVTRLEVFLFQLVPNMQGVLAQIHNEIIVVIGHPALNAIINGSMISEDCVKLRRKYRGCHH
jgi:hypothetical protein